MTAGIEERVRKLEGALVRMVAGMPPPSEEKSPLIRAWEIIQPFILTLATVAATWYLVERAKQSIEERELEGKNATELRGLLQGIYAATTRDDATANALAAALFGRDAAPPLIQLLDEGSDIPMVAAKKGLRAAGVKDPDGTCPILTHVLHNRTRLYKWSTHQVVIDLLTTLNCPNAVPELRSYGQLLDSGPEKYEQSVIVPSGFSDKMVELRADINASLARLSASKSE